MFGYVQNTLLWFRSRFILLLGQGQDKFDEGPLGWSNDLIKYENVQFSMAAIQANMQMEDYSQVETGPGAIFVGLYDGHGGIDTSRYISERLFPNLLRRLEENHRDMSENVMRQAIYDTEDGFMTLVENGYGENPNLATVGSCCLVGLIWEGKLYLANLGDSRAVIGTENNLGVLRAEQLTSQHTTDSDEHKRQLMQLHSQDDPQFLRIVRGVLLIKGLVKVSRTIGDAYLKRLPCTLEKKFPGFDVPLPFDQAILSREPEIITRILAKKDKFLIFGSCEFWALVSPTIAAETIQNNPRQGISKRLRRAALEKAAGNDPKKYLELRESNTDSRSRWHDDITVIVVFLDQEGCGGHWMRGGQPQMSYRAYSETVIPSGFTSLK